MLWLNIRKFANKALLCFISVQKESRNPNPIVQVKISQPDADELKASCVRNINTFTVTVTIAVTEAPF